MFNFPCSFSLVDGLYTPPSYKGVSVGVRYYVIIEIEMEDSARKTYSKSFQIPVKIRNPMSSFHKVFVMGNIFNINWHFQELEIYQDKRKKDLSLSDVYKNIRAVLEKKKKSNFAISYKGLHVTTFVISSLKYTLGEDIVGMFDFKNKEIECKEMKYELLCLEKIDKEFLRIEEKIFLKDIGRNVFFKERKNTINVEEFSVIIPLPCGETPNFMTDIFDIRWCLDFVFILDVDGKSEIMKWSLPLEVFEEPTSLEKTVTRSGEFLLI